VRAMMTARPSSELYPRKNISGTVSTAHAPTTTATGLPPVEMAFQEATTRAGAVDARAGPAGDPTDSSGTTLGLSMLDRIGDYGGPLHPLPIYRGQGFC